MIAKLEQLGALHDKGILTDEEFAAQKAKIPGGDRGNYDRFC